MRLPRLQTASFVRLCSPLNRGALVTTNSTATVTARAFSSLEPRRSAHHDEEPAPEEHLADNPKYLAVGGLVFGSLALFGFDKYYEKLNGHSYFGEWIHPTPDAEIADENVHYQQRLDESAQVYEALFVQPSRGPFRDVDHVQVIRRGSPFNREPGSSINVDALGPRREKKSIFD